MITGNKWTFRSSSCVLQLLLKHFQGPGASSFVWGGTRPNKEAQGRQGLRDGCSPGGGFLPRADRRGWMSPSGKHPVLMPVRLC